MSIFYKCKQNVMQVQIFISDANAFYKDVDAKCPYDADVPCRGVNAKFIHDDASARIQTMMQMSPYRDGDANVFLQVCKSANAN